eukprot:6188739-Pleurochrysis_carterae.AAC.1
MLQIEPANKQRQWYARQQRSEKSCRVACSGVRHESGQSLGEQRWQREGHRRTSLRACKEAGGRSEDSAGRGWKRRQCRQG